MFIKNSPLKSPRKTVEDWVRCAPVKKKVCKNTYTYTCKEIPQSKCKEVLISEMVWVMAEQCQGKYESYFYLKFFTFIRHRIDLGKTDGWLDPKSVCNSAFV